MNRLTGGRQVSRIKNSPAPDWTKASNNDPKARALYEKRAAKDHRVPYRLAVSDYFKGKNLLSREIKVLHTKKVGRKTNGKS